MSADDGFISTEVNSKGDIVWRVDRNERDRTTVITFQQLSAYESQMLTDLVTDFNRRRRDNARKRTFVCTNGHPLETETSWCDRCSPRPTAGPSPINNGMIRNERIRASVTLASGDVAFLTYEGNIYMRRLNGDLDLMPRGSHVPEFATVEIPPLPEPTPKKRGPRDLILD